MNRLFGAMMLAVRRMENAGMVVHMDPAVLEEMLGLFSFADVREIY